MKIDYSKISDFELSILIANRDIAAYEVERYDEILNKIGEVKGFAEAEKPKESGIDEKVFSTLKFEPQTGQKLGSYEIADKTKNNSEDWQRGYDVLKKLEATIKDRAKGQNFTFWIYGSFERIYRQQRKAK